jgi:hypothetical protein
MQLSDFPHVAGIHCSSSSIADILRYDGQGLPEAMVFGMGSGLGFVQSSDARFSPRYRFNGRALDLEGKFFALFGAPLRWARRWAPETIEAALREGRPVIAQTGIAYLPYYDGVHFPLHGIVVTGWDGEHAAVADTFSNELQSITAAQLRARAAHRSAGRCACHRTLDRSHDARARREPKAVARFARSSLARIHAVERMRESATRWSLMAQALKPSRGPPAGRASRAAGRAASR